MNTLLLILLASQSWGMYVTCPPVVEGSIDTADISLGAVDTNRLNNDAVTTAKLITAAVQTSKLATDSVTSAKLLSDAGGLAKVTGGAAQITTAFLGIGMAPTARLAAIGHDAAASGVVGALWGYASGYRSIIHYTDGFTYNFGAGTAANGDYIFESGMTVAAAGTERFRITQGGNVGIGTASPATKLHMSSGTMTIDGTGAGITVGPSSAPVFGVVANGSVNATSQPRAKLAAPAVTVGAAWAPITWATEVTNKGAIFVGATDSGKITVPTGGGGWWRSTCNVVVPNEGVGNIENYLRIVSNGATCSANLTEQIRVPSITNVTTHVAVTFEGEVADGATFTCCYYNATAQTLSANAYDSNFSAVKVW